jgi:hypothetical protein
MRAAQKQVDCLGRNLAPITREGKHAWQGWSRRGPPVSVISTLTSVATNECVTSFVPLCPERQLCVQESIGHLGVDDRSSGSAAMALPPKHASCLCLPLNLCSHPSFVLGFRSSLTLLLSAISRPRPLKRLLSWAQASLSDSVGSVQVTIRNTSFRCGFLLWLSAVAISTGWRAGEKRREGRNG